MGFFNNTEVIHSTSGGGYLNPSKIPDGGSVKFRILDAPVEGWEYWNEANKPVRLRKAPAVLPSDVRLRDGKPEKIKFFAAFCVWNYAEGCVQVMSLTQRGIMAALDGYADHEDYGSPLGYDLTLSRKGKGLETEYSLIASPPKQFPHTEDAAEVLRSINLNALFEGGNPFGGDSTPAAFDPKRVIVDAFNAARAAGAEIDHAWVKSALSHNFGEGTEAKDLTQEQAASIVALLQQVTPAPGDGEGTIPF